MSTLTTTRPPISTTTAEAVATSRPPISTTTAEGVATGRRALAVVRIAIGLTMLWAFLDKVFALGFATGRQEDGTIQLFGEAAWINGGSPTFGFLKFGTRGPFADLFAGMAGAWWADWLFMLGLLGIGAAFTFGVALRPAAGAGVLLMGMIWASALWPERNPFIDQHVIYAAAMVALAAANAGTVYGFGKAWGSTRVVQDHPILR